jgi:predicted phosphodiesterase
LGAQQNVADHMTRQIQDSTMPNQPSFFYHLGDIVYYTGDDLGYHDQFYHPYQDFPGPIFAIPGNHDGETRDPAETIKPFMKHFCSTEAAHAPEAGHSDRPTMIQPNCYWTLETPVATIVGLHSNVSGELDDTESEDRTQRDWLIQELSTAPSDKCLLVAVHHPIYSLGKHGGAKAIEHDLEHAMKASGRMPDVVLTGHDHCYQRFSRKRDGWRIPFLVVGAGGFAGYDDMTRVKSSLILPEDVKLKAYEDKRPGFLRVTITHDELIGAYFTVPKPGRENKPAKLRDEFTLNLRTHRLV